ncbi:MAG: PG0870-related protein [Bacteroidota bacterium]
MKTRYRYTLAPYQGPASRYTCPRCQRRRQFVRYIDTQQGTHLAEHVGRCNREINCGLVE